MKKTVLALMLSVCGLASAQMGPPNQPDMTVDAAQRTALVNSMINELNKNYVFPEKAKKMEAALRKHLKQGDYNNVSSAKKLSDLLTEHLIAETSDKHLRVMYSAEDLPELKTDDKPSPEQHAAEVADMKKGNFGVERVCAASLRPATRATPSLRR